MPSPSNNNVVDMPPPEKRRQKIDPHWVPRGLRALEAARYVGVSKSKFLEEVDKGTMPRPREWGGCVLWDSRELDDAFDALPRKESVSARKNSWDD